MSREVPPIVAALGRELVLRCDHAGVVRWVGPRAGRSLGARPGGALRDLCVPGTAAKAEAMLAQARAGQVTDWELSLIVEGAPTTVSFSAAPDPEDGVWLVGAPIPEHFMRALESVESSMSESGRLHREVVAQKRELERRHQELLRVHSELDDAHRGVLTLHSEITEHSDELRRQSEIKSRIVANVSHEFRTPLHSILGLVQLLDAGIDGPLGDEQRKQVRFIRSSAEDLLQLVNDVLDLTQVEANHVPMRIERFTLGEFVGSLRGMLRPLVPASGAVELRWDESSPEAELETDRGKLAQVLRNLVANALKFTARGQVRVRVEPGEHGEARFTVADTGVGIPREAIERIFEEFVQLDNPLQARHMGSGLGLVISRRLAGTLGGAITVESEVGVGSTFTLTVPRLHPEVVALQDIEARSRSVPVGPASILIVEDDRRALFIYEKYLTLAGFHVVPARDSAAARAVLARARPAAIVLDVLLENETSWALLADIKRDPATADIPVLVITVSDRERLARSLGADEFWLKPIDPERLVRKLRSLAPARATPRVLLIDDDERVHYLMRQFLRDTPYELVTAASGREGVAAARERLPQVILLDFLLRDRTAFEVLGELRADPRTAGIPVIIVTSYVLGTRDTQRLLAEVGAVLSKEHLSRELMLGHIHDALAGAVKAP
jgi:signal transduction histidine kinase/DNA-binding response OmpR family regulator